MTVTLDMLSYSATLMLGDSTKSYMKWLMLGFLLHQTWWFSVKQILGLNKCLIHSVGPCVPHVVYFLWQIAICVTTEKIIQILHIFKYLRDLSLIFLQTISSWYEVKLFFSEPNTLSSPYGWFLILFNIYLLTFTFLPSAKY